MIGRKHVTTTAEKLLVNSSSRPARVYIFRAPRVSNDVTSAPVYASKTKADCVYSLASPIPENPWTIQLLPGEELWLVSEDVALVGYSVEMA